jgi:acetyl esterase/lipase
MLTSITHALLRRTVKRWFAEDAEVEDTRRKLDRLMAVTDWMPRGVITADLGHAGSASLYSIGAADLPAKAPSIMYLHGGGYMVGGLTSHSAFCARLAQAVGGRVIFVDYRLAPEAPFPCAFQDCLGAWRMVADQQAGPMILAGDSAGGGLALAVAQAAIAEAARIPDRLILFSPWADMALSGESMISNAATDSVLSHDILSHMRDFYLQGHNIADPRTSPLLGSLRALPPTLIVCSDSEVLRDDSLRLADGMRGAGTPVTLLEIKGQPHVFPLFRSLPAAKKVLAAVGKFVG